MHCRTFPMCRSSFAPPIPDKHRRSLKIRLPIHSQPQCCRFRDHAQCAAIRSTATAMSTCFLTTAPISIGRVRGFLNISIRFRPICRPESSRRWGQTQPVSAGSMNMPLLTERDAMTCLSCVRCRTGSCAMNCRQFPALPKSPRSAVWSNNIRSCSTRPGWCLWGLTRTASSVPFRTPIRKSAVPSWKWQNENISSGPTAIWKSSMISEPFR